MQKLLLKLLVIKKNGIGNFAEGIKLVKKALTDTGYDEELFNIVDGSGVSHYNLLAPKVSSRYTNRMVPLRDDFIEIANTLSIGGQNGSLSKRFKNSILNNIIHGKTGSMSAVDAISGYLIIEEKPIFSFVFYC